jgi:poly(3-hydroxybutyrate) depolymerase
MNDRDNNLALMLDNPLFRTQYERAVLDAMQQAGIPAGSDVVLTGFSQGGIMAANLAADSSFPYNPIGVVTNGSPVDNFHVPPNVPVYAFQHATDVVPMLDGSLVGVPGLPGQSPFDIPNTPVTVLPPNIHQITLPDPDGAHGFGAHNNPKYATSVAEWEAAYRDANGGTDPWDLAGLGGTVVDHQVYQGVER